MKNKNGKAESKKSINKKKILAEVVKRIKSLKRIRNVKWINPNQVEFSYGLISTYDNSSKVHLELDFDVCAPAVSMIAFKLFDLKSKILFKTADAYNGRFSMNRYTGERALL